MKRVLLFIVGVGLLVLGGAGSVGATLITFEFEGQVNRVDDTVNNIQSGSISVGDYMSGSFTIDTTSPDTNPDDPETGSYVMDSSLVDFRFNFNGDSLSQTSPDFEFHVVARNTLGDFNQQVIAVAENDFDSIWGWTPEYMIMGIYNHTSLVLENDYIPTDIDLSQWDGGSWRIAGGGTKLTGSIDVISRTAPVPEPATIFLFGTSLAGLAGSRLRRKKK